MILDNLHNASLNSEQHPCQLSLILGRDAQESKNGRHLKIFAGKKGRTIIRERRFVAAMRKTGAFPENFFQGLELSNPWKSY